MKTKTKFNHLRCIVLILGLAASCIGCRQTSGDGTFTGGQTAESTTEVVSGNLGAVGSGSEDTTEPEETEAETTVEQAPAGTTQASASDGAYTFEPRNETVYTTVNLNIRREPSTDAEIVTTLSLSTPITRTGYHDEWSRLDYGGIIVYAVSEYLTTVEPNIPEVEINVEDLDTTIRHFGYDPNGPRDANNAPADMAWYIRNWGEWATFLQDTSKKEIYLTFDMGYEIGYTAQILDVLKEHDIKAVFFLVGEYAETAPDLVWRMINEGHILGNHSYGHPSGGIPSLSIEDQIADTMYMHNLVMDTYGYDMKLYRFPSGTYSTQSLEVISQLGYDHVFYSFYYHDYYVEDQPDPAEALEICLEELHPGAIYMFHTISSTNAEIFDEWVEGVLARGYTFGVYPVE